MIVRRLIGLPLALAATAWLAACGGGDDTTAPPTGVTATASDGRIVVSWNAVAGNQYWVFYANTASLTTDNWLNLASGVAIVNAPTPINVCGLVNGLPYWFTINARTGSEGGGPGSPLVTATPRPAGGVWTAGAPLGGPLNGIGYTPLTTCQLNPARAPSGLFAAVGPKALIYTSNNGSAWSRSAAPAGFTTDLNDVAGTTGNINNTSDPQLRFVAVGAGGASVYSTDGSTWAVGAAFDPTRPALRAVAVSSGVFVAVGDGGRIQTSTDGIGWTVRASGTTENLRGVTVGAVGLVAVGDKGTTAISSDNGVNWNVQTVAGVGNLRGVAYGSGANRFVAVGNAGVAALGTPGANNTVSWTTQPISAGTALSAVSYLSWFVAVAENGAAFTSPNGSAWSGSIDTGVANLADVTTSGFGYFAVGAGGGNTVSF